MVPVVKSAGEFSILESPVIGPPRINAIFSAKSKEQPPLPNVMRNQRCDGWRLSSAFPGGLGYLWRCRRDNCDLDDQFTNVELVVSKRRA